MTERMMRSRRHMRWFLTAIATINVLGQVGHASTMSQDGLLRRRRPTINNPIIIVNEPRSTDVTEAEKIQTSQRGDIIYETIVHIDGVKQWLPTPRRLKKHKAMKTLRSNKKAAKSKNKMDKKKDKKNYQKNSHERIRPKNPQRGQSKATSHVQKACNGDCNTAAKSNVSKHPQPSKTNLIKPNQAKSNENSIVSAEIETYQRQEGAPTDLTGINFKLLEGFFSEMDVMMSIPTKEPTRRPSTPTRIPTASPADVPSIVPTERPTARPTAVVEVTPGPTAIPTWRPTEKPTLRPVISPTPTPTVAPSLTPTKNPTRAPTESPTNLPSVRPSKAPTSQPTITPTSRPTFPPSNAPTLGPIFVTTSPTRLPPSLTASPSSIATIAPTSISPTQPRVCNPPISPEQRAAGIFDIVSDVSEAAMIENTGTPQNQAFAWLVERDEAGLCPDDSFRIINRYILALLYFGTDGNFWSECNASPGIVVNPCPSTRFLSSSNECQWFGVTCDDGGNVITTRIAENNLNGFLPSEFGFLESIEAIDFNRNNNISGSLPSSLGQLARLKILNLERNRITGFIPTELFNAISLQILDLDQNDIRGTVPTNIGNLNQLEVLELSDNNLSGSLPSEIGLLVELEFLLVNRNRLSGPIPFQINNNVELRAISLQSNNLSGTLPTVMGTLGQVETINLFDNSFSGTIPTELGLLFNLENMFLHFNEFSGTMPLEICNLRRLSLRALVADCGPRGRIQCPPGCCTLCF